jgi:hypothetical protein
VQVLLHITDSTRCTDRIRRQRRPSQNETGQSLHVKHFLRQSKLACPSTATHTNDRFCCQLPRHNVHLGHIELRRKMHIDPLGDKLGVISHRGPKVSVELNGFLEEISPPFFKISQNMQKKWEICKRSGYELELTPHINYAHMHI